MRSDVYGEMIKLSHSCLSISPKGNYSAMTPGKFNRYLRTRHSAHSVIDCTTLPEYLLCKLFGDVPQGSQAYSTRFHMKGK